MMVEKISVVEDTENNGKFKYGKTQKIVSLTTLKKARQGKSVSKQDSFF